MCPSLTRMVAPPPTPPEAAACAAAADGCPACPPPTPARAAAAAPPRASSSKATPAATSGAPQPPPPDLARALARTPKWLPCRFLYDELGSQLYERITQLPEYEAWRAERALLEVHASEVAAWVPPGAVVVELGCGDASKTTLLLRALLAAAREAGEGSVRYVGEGSVRYGGGLLGRGAAPDGCHAARRAARAAPRGGGAGGGRVPAWPGGGGGTAPRGAAGGPVDGQLGWVGGWVGGGDGGAQLQLCCYSLGCWQTHGSRCPPPPPARQVGNFAADEAVECLAALRRAAGPSSSLLLGADLWKAPARLHAAYDDAGGVTRRFIQNGARNALRALGHPAAEEDPEGLWAYEARVNEAEQQAGGDGEGGEGCSGPAN